MRKLILIVLVGVIPVIGYFTGLYVKSDYETQWLTYVEKELGSEASASVKSGQLLSLKQICNNPKVSNEDFCSTYHSVLLLQYASVAAFIAGLMLLAGIFAAARLAASNRNLLVTLFSPGLNVVLYVLFALIIVQGAIATYGVYIFEVTAVHKVHVFLIGGIGLGALIGSFNMIRAGLSISCRVKSTVVGTAVSREEQPKLWKFVAELAGRLGAMLPQHIIIGLTPNFYVTSADITVIPGSSSYSDETLYLSLPLMRILSREELAAVIGHELGHFRGQDTKFSLKFYPIYAGTTQALQALEETQSGKDNGAESLALLPAVAILSFFLDEFAKAERTIGRERELEADKAGASVSSPRAIATSLLKIGAFVALWSSIRSAMINALNQGKAYTNVSMFFAEVAVSTAKPELVDEVAENATVHPIDTHPRTRIRVEALGISVASLRDDALSIDPNSSSALLLDNVSELEEYLTDLEHRILLELGYAQLPEAQAEA
jgi:Zn-dependent protease with chaperone function